MKLKGEYKLLKVTNRVEKAPVADEAGPPGFDLKIEGERKLEECADLFSGQGSFDASLGCLYGKNGDLHSLDVDHIRLNTEGINLKATIKTTFGEPMKFKDAKLNRIYLSPQAGGIVGVTARLQLSGITDEQMAAVLKAQHQGISVSVSGRTQIAEDEKKQDKLGLEGGGPGGGPVDEEEEDDRPGVH